MAAAPSADGGAPARARPPDLIETVDRLGDRLVLLVDQSMALMRLEVRTAARQAARSAAMVAGASVCAVAAYAFLSLAAYQALCRLLPGDAAALVLAVGNLALAVGMLRVARVEDDGSGPRGGDGG